MFATKGQSIWISNAGIRVGYKQYMFGEIWNQVGELGDEGDEWFVLVGLLYAIHKPKEMVDEDHILRLRVQEPEQ